MRSLRSRIVLVVLFATAVTLVVADVVLVRAMRQHLVAELDQSLRSARLPLARADGLADDGPADDRPAEDGPDDDGDGDGDRRGGPLSSPVFVQTRSSDGTILETVAAPLPDGATASPLLPATITLPAARGDVEPELFFGAPGDGPGAPGFRVKVTELPSGSQLIIAAPLTSIDETVAELRRLVISISVGAVVLAGLVAFVLVPLVLRQLRQVEAAAQAIAEGDLTRRAALATTSTEVGRLGASFDAMVDRLTTALDASAQTEAKLRRFVADAAHELRTPIAAVSSYAELIESGAASQPADVERAATGARAEARRLATLVEDLLTLARLDDGSSTRPEPVEIVSIAADAIDAARAIGPEWPVRLKAAAPVDTLGDGEQLRRAIDNLLANVRVHTPPGTECTVTVAGPEPGDRPGRFRISVADHGPGMTGEQRAQSTERFWRSDGSRTRRTGGAGLGLAIVAGIADGHGGMCAVVPTEGGGTTVVLDLPLRPSGD